jgi:HEAT repeat protein
MARISIYKRLGIPDTLAVTLSVFCLLLLLSPYLGGTDFGIFKIPQLPQGVTGVLKWLGPVAFLLGAAFFFPLVREATAEPKKAGKRQVEKLIEKLKHGNARGRREAALELSKLQGAAELALPDLIMALDDPDPHVRENATQALEVGGSAAVRHLVAVLRHQKGLAIAGPIPIVSRPIPPLRSIIGEEDVRAALVDIGQAAVPALTSALEQAGPAQKAPIAATLKRIQTSELDQVITQGLSAEDDDIRLSAAAALAEGASKEDIPALAILLHDKHLYVRVVAIVGLGKTRSRDAVAFLVDTLNREDESTVRYEVVRALAQLAEHTAEAIPPLVEALKDPTLLVQLIAVTALGEIGPAARAAVPQLLDGLKHEDWSLRQYAATALGKIGSHEAIPALTHSLEDEHEKVREAAAEALERLQ